MVGIIILLLALSLISTVGLYYITRQTFQKVEPESELEMNIIKISIILLWVEAIVIVGYASLLAI